jgi:hypothetical protein
VVVVSWASPSLGISPSLEVNSIHRFFLGLLAWCGEKYQLGFDVLSGFPLDILNIQGRELVDLYM